MAKQAQDQRRFDIVRFDTGDNPRLVNLTPIRGEAKARAVLEMLRRNDALATFLLRPSKDRR